MIVDYYCHVSRIFSSTYPKSNLYVLLQHGTGSRFVAKGTNERAGDPRNEGNNERHAACAGIAGRLYDAAI